MTKNLITYRITDADGDAFVVPVEFHACGDALDQDPNVSAPHWAELENHRCSNCPLDPVAVRYCPAALAINEIATRFNSDLSITRVDVQVETINRTYVRNTDLQTCLRSLFGLVMATSGCPVLSKMRAMAVFHLPFSTLEETIFRIVGTYLIKQYLRMRDGEEPDWELKGIGTFYKELGVVNLHLMKRLRAASNQDANVNAIQQFVSIATLTEISMDSYLEEFGEMLKEYC